MAGVGANCGVGDQDAQAAGEASHLGKKVKNKDGKLVTAHHD